MPIDPQIKKIKIHPAIGFARLSTNQDYYVFGDPPAKYKSNNRMKRQAVQFRLFAYGDNNNGLYELTAEKLNEMGLKAIWSIHVCNRKIAKQINDPNYVISALGDTRNGDANLVGKCGDFAQGQAIPLGTMTANGLFIPPIAGIFKRRADTPVPPWGMYNADITDNTSDGTVGAQLVQTAGGSPPNVPVFPAWVATGPQDFAPAWNDPPGTNLLHYLERLLHTPNIVPTNPVNKRAQEIDRGVLISDTSKFNPGLEVSGPFTPGEFYPASETGDPDEIRFLPRSARPAAAAGFEPGVEPGGITSELCSPWQGDFLACNCYWWPNQRPDLVFRNDGTGPEANWLRKIADQNGASPPGGVLDTIQQMVSFVDQLGVVLKVPPEKRAETERNNNIPGAEV